MEVPLSLYEGRRLMEDRSPGQGEIGQCASGEAVEAIIPT